MVLTDALRPFSPTDVLRCLVCRVWCFEVAGRSSGLSGVRLLLGLPGVSKQAHLVVQRIQEEQHLKSSLKEKDKEIDSLHDIVINLEVRLEHQEQHSRRTVFDSITLMYP